MHEPARIARIMEAGAEPVDRACAFQHVAHEQQPGIAALVGIARLAGHRGIERKPMRFYPFTHGARRLLGSSVTVHR